MLTLREAIKIAEKNIPQGQTLRRSYGEAQGKYVLTSQNSMDMIPPGGFNWTVDKETGECKFEHLEREGNQLWSPIRGYKKLYLEDEP